VVSRTDTLEIPLDAETKAIERPEDHKAELRVWLRLLTCTNIVEAAIRQRLRQTFDVTLPRFDLLAQLYKSHSNMTLGELSSRLMVSNGNVTGLTERLCQQGLVRRNPSPDDRRVQLIRLTPDGRRVFRSMAQAHEKWIAEILGDLSKSELESLMTLLAKTKKSARKAVSSKKDDRKVKIINR
jgi:DNA-binding MarR family transcriptional regulator